MALGLNVSDTKDKKYADTGFLAYDLELALKTENVSIHIVSSCSQEIRPKDANHIIDTWCWSKNKTSIKVQPVANFIFDPSCKYQLVTKHKDDKEDLSATLRPSMVNRISPCSILASRMGPDVNTLVMRTP